MEKRNEIETGVKAGDVLIIVDDYIGDLTLKQTAVVKVTEHYIFVEDRGFAKWSARIGKKDIRWGRILARTSVRDAWLAYAEKVEQRRANVADQLAQLDRAAIAKANVELNQPVRRDTCGNVVKPTDPDYAGRAEVK